MAKYSFEIKKKIVSEYLSMNKSSSYLARKYDITNKNEILKWVDVYKTLGDEGLMRSRKNKKYSFEFKLNVVKLYLTSEVSYKELSLSQGINNPSLIPRWMNDFRKDGPDALRPKRKGRKKALNSNKNETHKVENIIKTSVDTSTEHIKKLEDELLKLRIENAYLKELRRLRLEEEALLKKQRE